MHEMYGANHLKISAKMRKVTEHIYYDETACLGRGSSGTVYKGYHNLEQKIVACKIIPAKFLKLYEK